MEIIKTKDGSSSLFLADLNETYHSTHGAISESTYVYIEMGLRMLKKSDPVNILEVGFGTGLNVLLTYLEAQKIKTNISLTTLEPHPIPLEVIEKLNYGKILKNEEIYLQLHHAPWGRETAIGNCLQLNKVQTSLEDYTPDQEFDLVYFDAFAPSKQPDIWKPENLEKVSGLMKRGGLLVTYCAQGQFRRNLEGTGLKVERLPGPPPKKEMIRGKKK